MPGTALLTHALSFNFRTVRLFLSAQLPRRMGLAAAFTLITCLILAQPVIAAEIKVLKMGLGSGTVSSAPGGINCGNTCDFDFPSGNVTLSVTFNAADTRFAGWQGTGFTCPGMGDCM